MHPKVCFGYAGAKKDAEAIHSFYTDNCSRSDWNNCIFSAHPPLREKLMGTETERKEISAISSYSRKVWQEEYKMIKSQLLLFESEWGKMNGEFTALLPRIMETQWPADRRHIRTNVSINPVCLRSLEDWSFDIYYLKGIIDMKETVAHETAHFLYFKKWKEVFPDSHESSYESPNLVWQLSEIIAPIILNDRKVRALVGRKVTAYQQFETARIGDRPLMAMFEEIYDWKIAKRKSFEEFLKAAHEEARRNAGELSFLI